MDISFSEMFWIAVFTIIVFGPKKLPEIARGLGNGIRTLRNATDDIKKEIMKDVDDINPVNHVKSEINDFKSEITKIQKDLDPEEGSVKR